MTLIFVFSNLCESVGDKGRQTYHHYIYLRIFCFLVVVVVDSLRITMSMEKHF